MDLREVRRVIELVENSAIDELEIEEGGTRIRVRKGVPTGAAQAGSQAVPAQLPPSGEGAPSAGTAQGPSVVTEDTSRSIDSPMVGTFYRSPSPEAAPFVQVGSQVDEESVVCILEAMKVMNEIKAGLSGKIVEVLVENSQPVEFGQPMFRVTPA